MRDVHAFVQAVQKGDRAGFEAGLDRAALRKSLGRQVVQLGRAQGLEVEGGPSEFALDRMVTVDKLRITEPDGASASALATPERVKPLLRKTDAGRVCLHDGSEQRRCVLTFARRKAADGQAAGWKLVDMPADGTTVALAPPRK